MRVLLLICASEDCPVVYFRSPDGRCSHCHKKGRPVVWALKPPKGRPPDDDIESGL